MRRYNGVFITETMRRRLMKAVICVLFVLCAAALNGAAMASEAGTPTPLSAPDGLGWGRDYSITVARYNQEHKTDLEYVDFPGMMYWSLGEETRYTYAISLYRQEAEGSVLVEEIPKWTVSRTSNYGCCFRFLLEDREDGDYYFKIKALGDGVYYEDSEEVTSPSWHYALPVQKSASSSGTGGSENTDSETDDPNAETDPGSESGAEDSDSENEDSDTDSDTDNSDDSGGESDSGGNSGSVVPVSDKVIVLQLAQLYCPRWIGSSSVTVQAMDPEHTVGFQIRWFYQHTLEKEKTTSTTAAQLEQRQIGSVLTFLSNGVTVQVPEKMLAENGAGWYSFQIRALSSDISTLASSPWSDMSRQRYFSAESDSLTTIVSAVRADSPPEDKQKAIQTVREIGVNALRRAMAADQDNTAAAGQIQRLEELTGTQAKVSVSEELSELFLARNITVIGAGLNVDAGEKVTLEIDQPGEEQELPSAYNNAIWFSMRLADEDGEEVEAESGELPVPIKIALPVPAEVNPEYFVLLHHHADGTYEEIENPRLYQERGQWYASFLVVSFSDFTIAERAEIVQASRTAEGVEVTYDFRDAAGTVCCAVYGQGGKLLSAAYLETGSDTVLLPCDSAEAARVKVFTLDAQSPTAAARVLPLPASG